jgi:hypothetical protein
MKKKILSIFVMCMGIIVPALVADNATTTASATVEEKENPPFTYMADGPDDDVIVTIENHKEDWIECTGHVYGYYENGEEHFIVLDTPDQKDGYTYYNSFLGTKTICHYSEESLCRQLGCAIHIIGK